MSNQWKYQVRIGVPTRCERILAQRSLAYLHRLWGVKEGYGIKENKRVAYMWYTLAAASGVDTLGSRSIVAEEMTTEEEAEALEMVRDWKPGQCPAP